MTLHNHRRDLSRSLGDADLEALRDQFLHPAQRKKKSGWALTSGTGLSGDQAGGSNIRLPQVGG